MIQRYHPRRVLLREISYLYVSLHEYPKHVTHSEGQTCCGISANKKSAETVQTRDIHTSRRRNNREFALRTSAVAVELQTTIS